ncbi:MAG: dienelactone hydrolase family protein [Verrucomicrobiota bacterium]
MKTSLFLVAWLSLAAGALAAVKAQPVEYREGGTVLEGWHAYDDSIAGTRPGVLVVHQWKGLGDYEKKRAEMLAKLGYNVFCVDIYGKGVRAANPQDASKLAGKYKSDRALLRARVNAALEALKKHSLTDPDRVAAMGYCFGGTTVLELARSGAKLSGVVSFHGNLDTPSTADARKIQCKVLVLHGADDPVVPPAQVAAFEEEMRQAKVDWQLVAYGDAVHSFTDWGAGSDKSRGSAYNEKADKRSWEAMKVFFGEIFAK